MRALAARTYSIERKIVVNEPNPFPNLENGSSLSDDQQAIPMGQQPMGATTSDQESSRSGEMPPKASDPPSEHAKGVIPKAAEAAEKAAEKGLEKTSSVVGSTIDKVADAAINALGGGSKNNGQN
jgi:hypothetical protein